MFPARWAQASAAGIPASGHNQHPVHLGGALCGLDKIIAQRGKGLGNGLWRGCARQDARGIGEIFTDLEPEDLLKFGLIPEFVGRLPVLATLEDLDEDALVTILTAAKERFGQTIPTLCSSWKTPQLTFTEDALSAIAKRAIERKTGARGLRSILEDIFLDTMFELPGMDSVTEVVVNEEAVMSDAAPLMIHAETEKEPAHGGLTKNAVVLGAAFLFKSYLRSEAAR